MGELAGAFAILAIVEGLKRAFIQYIPEAPKWLVPVLVLCFSLGLSLALLNQAWRESLQTGFQVALMAMGLWSGQKALRGK